IPAELETVVLKAMAKDPHDRYATAGELADDLRCFLEDRPIRARRPTLPQRLRKWSRRHRAVVWSGAAVLAVAVLGLAVSAVLLLQERDRTRAANVRLKVNLRLALKAMDKVHVEMTSTRLHSSDPHQKKHDLALLRETLTFYEQF